MARNAGTSSLDPLDALATGPGGAGIVGAVCVVGVVVVTPPVVETPTVGSATTAVKAAVTAEASTLTEQKEKIAYIIYIYIYM